MAKRIDLVGGKYGRLTVVGEAEEYRKNIILELNKQGANYSASHGK